MPSPGFTTAENVEGTPASTNKLAEDVVDDSDSSETSDTDDQTCSNGEASTCGKEASTYDLFEDNGHLGQMFKDKKTLKEDLGMHALTQRFEYNVRRSNHTRFVATCKKRDCQWVFRAGKSRNGTYWHVMSVDNKHTYGDNGNYNVDFHRVSCHVIGELFSRIFADTGRNLRPKDIICDIGISTGFNTVIRPVITVDATHLKSKTMCVLLVAVYKDGNEMIYPLAFEFTNSENIKSWTWFLTQLNKDI
ncbi:hypothetical protein Dsin_019250 [Dipteronia sinensis]|uniref:Transposase MuDR plant domain-containing protein n=1 Tax=Dipteronia sinensis TaxID=43782 RepID=A0AAE0A7P7_9ROSI|nr:hypothetical protein Dsin_019250 [Dipteronia sinensis]